MSGDAMVARIARTLADAWIAEGEVPFPLYDREAAVITLAVLSAMREPTALMLRAVDDDDADPMVARGRAYSAWTSMIDAALAESCALCPTLPQSSPC